MLALAALLLLPLGTSGSGPASAQDVLASTGDRVVQRVGWYETRLDLALRPQQRRHWCWVTGVQGVVHWVTGAWPRQCDLHKAGTGWPVCPEDPGSDTEILRALRTYGVDGRVQQGPLAFGDVVREIRAGRPVLAVVRWRSGAGQHLVAIAGYDLRTRGVHLVLIPDGATGPSRPTRLGAAFPYDALVASDVTTWADSPAGPQPFTPHDWVRSYVGLQAGA